MDWDLGWMYYITSINIFEIIDSIISGTIENVEIGLEFLILICLLTDTYVNWKNRGFFLNI